MKRERGYLREDEIDYKERTQNTKDLDPEEVPEETVEKSVVEAE